MNEPSVPQVSKRRWSTWYTWLIILLVVAGAGYVYVWYQARVHDARLSQAIQMTDASDPHWRWTDLVKEYEKLPLSQHFPQLILAWRGYLGWFGDDIGGRPGAIPYDREGRHFAVRFPEPYFKILKERLAEPEATGLKAMRAELLSLEKEPIPSRVPFDDNNLMQRARYISNYLLDEMELAIHENRLEALSPLLRSQLRLANYCLATPKPINQLVGLALRSQGCSGIKRGLSLGSLSPSILMQCQKLLEKEDKSHLVHILRSLRAEQFDDLEMASNDPVRRQKLRNDILSQVAVPSKPSFADRLNYWWKWLETEASLTSLSLAKAELLESSSRAIEMAETKPEQLVKLDPARWPVYIPMLLQSIKHPLARQYVQMNFKLASAEMTNRAELRALIAALASERYRLTNKVWPGTLGELVPGYLQAIPLDPYTGKELLYRKLPNGIVIYSVHLNQTDDGGNVLYLDAPMKDRGVIVFNPEERGKRYEDLKPSNEE